MVFLGALCYSGHIKCIVFPEEPLLPRLGVPLPVSRPLLRRIAVLPFETWSASCFEVGVIFFLPISSCPRARGPEGWALPLPGELGLSPSWAGGGPGSEPPPTVSSSDPFSSVPGSSGTSLPVGAECPELRQMPGLGRVLAW